MRSKTIFTVTEPGNYYVTGAPSLCPNYIEGPGVTLDVIDCPVGIEENYSAQISIYPNPAENIIHILNGKQSQEYFILDAIGKFHGFTLNAHLVTCIEIF